MGAPLMDFIWLPPEISEGLFGQLQKLYLLCVKNGEDYEQTIQSFQPFVLKALGKNIYLYFCVLAYTRVLLHGLLYPKKTLKRLALFLTDKGKGLDMDDIRGALKHWRADIAEMTDIDTLYDLIRFELFHTLRENQPIKKCKYCGEYFIPHGRMDTEYCNRIKWGETKRCSEMGAIRNYWSGKTDDPVYKEFQKACKRNHSRVKHKTIRSGNSTTGARKRERNGTNARQESCRRSCSGNGWGIRDEQAVPNGLLSR